MKYMKTSLKRIYTRDNIELVGLLYEPDQGSEKILVHVHGMAGNFYENAFLDALAQELTSNNIGFFAFNNRGCESFKDLVQVTDGKRKYIRIGNAYEKFEDSVLDIEAAINVVSEWGFSEIHLSGHSLGSPKVAYYLAETKDLRIKSLLLLSPSDMLGLVRDDMENFNRDITEATDLVNAGRGRELISHQVWGEYPMSADTYLNLFADNSKAGVFNFFKPDDSLDKLAQITQPIFAIMGRKDSSLIVSIDETMHRILSATKSSSHTQSHILGDANHGYDGFENELAMVISGWILSEKV